MLSCHKLWFLLVTMIFVLENHKSCAKPVAEAAADANAEAANSDIPKLLLITDDVIADNVEHNQKKVIRVNPLDLPPIQEDASASNVDSSLHNIQLLKPYKKRKYTNMRRPKPQMVIESRMSVTDTPIIRGFPVNTEEKFLKPKHQPKKKNLHFLYNQEDLAGNLLSKTMRVHLAPGAYPVYYVLSKTNGRFGKHPLKSFNSPKAFMKYLQQNKLETLPALETYEAES